MIPIWSYLFILILQIAIMKQFVSTIKIYWINAIKDELNNLHLNKIITFVSEVLPVKNIIFTK